MQSVVFAFGSTLTTFVKPFGGGFDAFAGSYMTDTGGALTCVANMMDVGVGTDTTTNLRSTPQMWFLIGANHMFTASGGQVWLDNVDTIINASAWTLAPASGGASVPEIDAARPPDRVSALARKNAAVPGRFWLARRKGPKAKAGSSSELPAFLGRPRTRLSLTGCSTCRTRPDAWSCGSG